MPFLYHGRPGAMRGDVLYPLNLLRTTHPDVYEHERAKYAGRNLLLDLRIPILDVLWNDALHLSPFHPSHLAAAWRAAGLSTAAWERDFFEIPVERVAGRPCVWFATGALSVPDDRREDDPVSLAADEVTRFDPTAYEELVEPPPAYLEYLRNVQKRGRPPRAFAHIPHVLVAAPIPVSGLSLARADGAPR